MNFKSELPCIICNESRDNMVTMHHIYTRGAYPEFKDARWNKMPLCLVHHNEAHNSGNISMSKKYSAFIQWLDNNNWEVFNDKLLHRD